jgi:hypothetical protein
MKITQAVFVLKRFPPPVLGAIGLVVKLLMNELVIRTRNDEIHLDLCR